MYIYGSSSRSTTWVSARRVEGGEEVVISVDGVSMGGVQRLVIFATFLIITL